MPNATVPFRNARQLVECGQRDSREGVHGEGEHFDVLGAKCQTLATIPAGRG